MHGFIRNTFRFSINLCSCGCKRGFTKRDGPDRILVLSPRARPFGQPGAGEALAEMHQKLLSESSNVRNTVTHQKCANKSQSGPHLAFLRQPRPPFVLPHPSVPFTEGPSQVCPAAAPQLGSTARHQDVRCPVAFRQTLAAGQMVWPAKIWAEV